MNSVTAPSLRRASRTNFAISAVRSTKPAPGVWTVRSDDTMVLALTVDGAERESDLGEVIKISLDCRPGERRDPYAATSRFCAVDVDTCRNS